MREQTDVGQGEVRQRGPTDADITAIPATPSLDTICQEHNRLVVEASRDYFQAESTSVQQSEPLQPPTTSLFSRALQAVSSFARGLFGGAAPDEPSTASANEEQRVERATRVKEINELDRRCAQLDIAPIIEIARGSHSIELWTPTRPAFNYRINNLISGTGDSTQLIQEVGAESFLTRLAKKLEVDVESGLSTAEAVKTLVAAIESKIGAGAELCYRGETERHVGNGGYSEFGRPNVIIISTWHAVPQQILKSLVQEAEKNLIRERATGKAIGDFVAEVNAGEEVRPEAARVMLENALMRCGLESLPLELFGTGETRNVATFLKTQQVALPTGVTAEGFSVALDRAAHTVVQAREDAVEIFRRTIEKAGSGTWVAGVTDPVKKAFELFPSVRLALAHLEAGLSQARSARTWSREGRSLGNDRLLAEGERVTADNALLVCEMLKAERVRSNLQFQGDEKFERDGELGRGIRDEGQAQRRFEQEHAIDGARDLSAAVVLQIAKNAAVHPELQNPAELLKPGRSAEERQQVLNAIAAAYGIPNIQLGNLSSRERIILKSELIGTVTSDLSSSSSRVCLSRDGDNLVPLNQSAVKGFIGAALGIPNTTL